MDSDRTVVSYYTNGGADVTVQNFGTTPWTHVLGVTEGYVTEVVLDDLGNAYVCGGVHQPIQATTTLAGAQDVYVQKLDAAGTVLWTTEFGSAQTDLCNALSFSRHGSLILTGIWDQALSAGGGDESASVLVASLDPATGTENWRTIHHLGSTGAASIAVDVVAEGADILVTGYTNETPIVGSLGREGFLLRLDESGVVQ